MIEYDGDVYRPPSEAYSLIIQATVGCSHNGCAFCSMYNTKRFRVRPTDEVEAEFAWARERFRRIDRIFLADGDALICPTGSLLKILGYIGKNIPECTRVSCYASPASLLRKTPEELSLLRAGGLALVYLGLESGNDEVLSMMNKGSAAAEIIEAGNKAKAAGMSLSVTAISGLGGAALTHAHAADTAKALSAMKPDYIGLLTLMVERGTPLCGWVESGRFRMLDPRQTLEETYELIAATDSEGSVFRMNHASNYLQLRGTLNYDRGRLLARIMSGLDGGSRLKDESMRAL
jgi:radical SAM superfamily enzyme YgiQ (UPF0313 family)